MLKWKSQDMTKANTIQARRKFKKRWPVKQLRVSVAEGAGTEDAADATRLPSLATCAASMSLGPRTFRATELQISQVLQQQCY